MKKKKKHTSLATCGSGTQENIMLAPETTSDGVSPTSAPATLNCSHCKKKKHLNNKVSNFYNWD